MPPDTTGLGLGEVRLWFAYTDALSEPTLAGAYRLLLNAEERARETRLRLLADRNAYLLARALLRTTLSRFAAVEPEDWVFEFNRHGKPSVAACHADALHLQFNLSHTRHLVVLALSHRRALGVDVEKRHPPADLLVAERFFNPREAHALRSLGQSERQQRFVELWTLKESYIKACGAGLSMSLGSFSFDLSSPGGIDLSFEPGTPDRPERWCFMQLNPDPGHQLALCTERTEHPLSLGLRLCVPLRGEWPVEWPIARSTAGLTVARVNT